MIGFCCWRLAGLGPHSFYLDRERPKPSTPPAIAASLCNICCNNKCGASCLLAPPIEVARVNNSRHIGLQSITSKRSHRIDLRRPPRRQITSEQRHATKERYRRGEDHWIAGLDVEQQRFSGPAQ